jgi:hypothetical protein
VYLPHSSDYAPEPLLVRARRDPFALLPSVNEHGRVQGKYYERARAGTNLVLLEPEIAEAFPDSKAVNEALGLLLRVARTRRLRAQAHEKTKSPTGRGVA